MHFTELSMTGAFLIEPEPIADARGFFARSFCREEFSVRGLNPVVAQCNFSFNQREGTLRGLHFQKPPHAEAKLVRCTRGSLYDVIVDLRPRSATFLQWQAFELSASNRLMLYVPEGLAHGFVTLEDNTEVFYQMSEEYRPEHAAGVRWNDPAFRIDWPLQNPILSEKDASYDDYQPGGGDGA